VVAVFEAVLVMALAVAAVVAEAGDLDLATIVPVTCAANPVTLRESARTEER